MSNLKSETRKALAEVLQKEGMPPIIDKTYNSIWDHFKATQPSVLSSSESKLKTEQDVWTCLQLSLEKFGVKAAYAKNTVTKLKKKFGESPSATDIKSMMS